MIGIQKDRFTRGSAGYFFFLFKLPDSAGSAVAGTMLYGVIEVKPDLMIPCFWVIIL
jgi:hypothetical protein